METAVKDKKRTMLLAVIVLLSVILLALVAAAVLLPEPAPKTVELPTEIPTEPETEPPTEATEPDYPPDLPKNPYGPNDFQFFGPYLSCTAGESILGIDVSEHQTITDWNAVKEAGIEYVFIRVGYRGYGSGTLEPDVNAQEFYEGAKAAGLKVGAYFFSQALNPGEARTEAKFVLKAIEGWELDMPVVFDWEYISEDARTANVSRLNLTLATKAFCKAIEDAGYRAMVYYNEYMAEYQVDLEQLEEYDLWLAMYSSRMTHPIKVDFWQYSATGRVPGIENEVDMNLWFPEETTENQ